LTSYDNREPVITDQRLARIETQIRLRFPTLPDGAEFATARIEEEGMAHLILLTPVPGVPDPFRMKTTRRVPLSLIAKHDKERGHYVSGGSEDPFLWSFEQIAADQTRRLASAADMIHPEDPE
jgi:hypothetical protein